MIKFMVGEYEVMKMSLRKMLSLILLVVVVMFSLMLSTSYAWYSFNNASTEFDLVTSNDDIMINY